MQDISEDFRFLARSYALVSFYETHVWPGTRDCIVAKGSSLLNLEHEDQIPLASNHTDMVKFDGLDDPMFVQVEKRINAAARGNDDLDRTTVSKEYGRRLPSVSPKLENQYLENSDTTPYLSRSTTNVYIKNLYR